MSALVGRDLFLGDIDEDLVELDEAFEVHLARVDADERSLGFAGRDAQGGEHGCGHREEVRLDAEAFGDGFEGVFHAVRGCAVGPQRVGHGCDKGGGIGIGQARAVGLE